MTRLSMTTLFIISACLQLGGLAAQESESSSGIALNSPWKQSVYQFAQDNLQHSAWGLEHYERNYQLARELAELESLPIDEDVLFAAAFLHDMGTFEPYVVAGAEHSQTAAENIESVLGPAGFPMEKLNAVNAVILAHMYYAEVPDDATAQVLHDADTLDFLGTIGVTRILSLTTRHAWATDLSTAISTLENFSEQLPPSLHTDAAKTMARVRVEEMRAYLSVLKQQSLNGAAL